MRVTSRFTTGGPSGIFSALNPPLGPPYVKGQVMAHTSASHVTRVNTSCHTRTTLLEVVHWICHWVRLL